MPQVLPYDEWPPTGSNERRLLLAHSFGRHIMQSRRDFAIAGIPADATQRERSIAEEAIAGTIYGRMMLLDGVAPAIVDDRHSVDYRMIGRIRDDRGEAVETFDVEEAGGGLCMGFHMWKANDFGPLESPGE